MEIPHHFVCFPVFQMTVEANNRKKHEQILLSSMSRKEFREMDENDDGKIDKWEYLVRQLLRQVNPAAHGETR